MSFSYFLFKQICRSGKVEHRIQKGVLDKTLRIYFKASVASPAHRIHVSRESRAKLVELGGYHLQEKGQAQIKVRK